MEWVEKVWEYVSEKKREDRSARASGINVT